MYNCGEADYAQLEIVWAGYVVGLEVKRSECQMPAVVWSTVAL